jgi:16S rRNA (cytosine967-C5)-methyltransferase
MPGDRRRPQRLRADPVRRAAFDVLDAVDSREAYANLLLPRLLSDRGITGRDAALATELAYGTLRGQGAYDAVLAACSDRPLGKLDPPVLLTLRIGAHQLLAMRVGSHAAVATSVDLAKDVAGPRASGYVNAVLRRVATRGLDEWLPIVAPSPDADPDGYLSVRYSYPRWIVAAYREALGAGAELEAALAAGNERPRVTMAVTPGCADRAQVMPQGAEASRWSPFGFTLPGGDPAGLVDAGRVAVQDEASQLAALLLARAELRAPQGVPAPSPAASASAVPPGVLASCGGSAPFSSAGGGAWLDVCAGPGGKARMLHGLAVREGARLVAAEVHPHRARLVKSALARPRAGTEGSLGTGNGGTGAAGVLVADGRRPAWRDGVFDRVLVDVPCTGLGALRRRPEARWRKSPADLRELGSLQRALLESALAATRPGGVVAYVTCSPLPAETSSVVAQVLGAGSRAQVLDAPALLPQVPDLRAAADPRFAQFWPHRHGTDAIFIAALRRSL